jgi:hypothetical protein
MVEDDHSLGLLLRPAFVLRLWNDVVDVGEVLWELHRLHEKALIGLTLELARFGVLLEEW